MVETVNKVFVNLEKGEVITQTVTRRPIFQSDPAAPNPKQRFRIEGDPGGFSCIEKRYDGYYRMNVLYGQPWRDGHPDQVDEERITEEEVAKIIRETMIENMKGR